MKLPTASSHLSRFRLRSARLAQRGRGVQKLRVLVGERAQLGEAVVDLATYPVKQVGHDVLVISVEGCDTQAPIRTR
jgi:hypothetical protein